MAIRSNDLGYVDNSGGYLRTTTKILRIAIAGPAEGRFLDPDSSSTGLLLIAD